MCREFLELLSREQIEAIVASDVSFKAYVTEKDTHPHNVCVQLIGEAYEIDGDELPDDEMIELIGDIIAATNHLLNTEY
jgi:hypothetical protein